MQTIQELETDASLKNADFSLLSVDFSSLLFSRGEGRKVQRRSRPACLSGMTCQRASARSSCRGGSGPPALLSWPGGSSRNDAAKARCAAAARMPFHRNLVFVGTCERASTLV